MQRFPDRPDELPTINRIVFTGDVFRVAQDEQEPSQLCNVFWLHNLVSYQLAQLTGIIPEICFRTRNSRIGYSLIRDAYKVLGLDSSVNGWRSSFWYEDVPDDLVKLFRPDYENALVFAFELSPIMECILNRLACCWVDIAVSPIRFLDDLLLSVRLSSHFKSEPLLPFVVSEKDIKDAADFVSRWFRSKRCESDLKADDVVFFAQTEGDRTLITGKGNFFPVEETIAALAEVVGERRLWIKPHPYALKNRVIQRITERLGGRLIEENVYAMLSADIDINVVTIASSVGREAPWFGKRTKLFYDRVLCRTEEGLTIGDSYCFSDFWTALLKQIMPVTSLHRAGRLDLRHQALRQTGLKPNSLREQLGFWGMPHDVWAGNAARSARDAPAADEIAAELAAMRNSTSWRLTAPLRALARTYRAALSAEWGVWPAAKRLRHARDSFRYRSTPPTSRPPQPQ
jgi:hypothetical protein